MAAFCYKCGTDIFQEDCGDLAGLTSLEDIQRGVCRVVLCECCGWILVNEAGARVDFVEAWEHRCKCYPELRLI